MIKQIKDIAAVNDVASQGKRIWNDMYIIPDKSIDYAKLTPETIDDELRTMAALPLTPEAKWATFSFAKYTPNTGSEGSSGDITSAVSNKVMGTLAGQRKEIDDFLENHLGEGFMVVEVDRITRKKTIHGRPYSPMFFTAFSKRNNADNASTDVTFSSDSFFQPLEYLGECTNA